MEENFLKSKLHQYNKRVTPQRMAVYKVLKENKNHPSAEEIHQKIVEEHPNISLATVYQILNLFEDDLSIIKSISIEHTKYYDIDSDFHIHIICPKCEKIKDIYSDKIKIFWEKLVKELKIKPEDQIIKIYQICAQCSKKIKN